MNKDTNPRVSVVVDMISVRSSTKQEVNLAYKQERWEVLESKPMDSLCTCHVTQFFSVVATFVLIENSFPLPLPDYSFPNGSGHPLFPAIFARFSLFCPCALQLRLLCWHLVRSRVTWVVLLQLTFVISLTLVDCRRPVNLQWFLAVKLRQVFVGPDQACRISCLLEPLDQYFLLIPLHQTLILHKMFVFYHHWAVTEAHCQWYG